MTEQHDFERWREIRVVHKENANFYRMLRGSVIIGLLVFIGLSVYQEGDEQRAFGMNLWTEFAGIAVTVLIIDELNRRRADDQRRVRLADSERQAEERYKRRLVDEAASTSNEIAKHAVYVMQRRGWLKGDNGLLVGANLNGADLRRAQLIDANLEGASLVDADLREANLDGANLRNADLILAKLDKAKLYQCQMHGAILEEASLREVDLREAILHKANLMSANLEKADLGKTNFREAILAFANLYDANMAEAHLEGADLSYANIVQSHPLLASVDTNTILPSGEPLKEWRDIIRFVDPQAPDFWPPDWVHRSEK